MSDATHEPKQNTPPQPGMVWICRRYITVKGKRVYPKKGKAFCFWAKPKSNA